MKRRRKPASKSPHAKDRALGARIKELREAKDPRITQVQLAGLVGVTYQQVQKYESGHTRIYFSRLCEISKALGVPIGKLIEPIC